MRGEDLQREVEALESGNAFAHVTGLRIVLVTGPDAVGWLNDLLTSGIHTLATGEATRSLLLSPTGRVRADVHAVRGEDGVTLVQAVDQPQPIDGLLSPYVLSAEVEIHLLDLELFAIPGVARPILGARTAAVSRPSILGSGVDLLTARDEAAELRRALLAEGLIGARPQAVETWRISRGVPRFPVDFGEDALPAEAGLESAIDFAKGCFLGQGSVAKVRMLGHPPRVVLACRASGRVASGERVRSGEVDVGSVTSAAERHGVTWVLARVRWDAREEPLTSATGQTLLRA